MLHPSDRTKLQKLQNRILARKGLVSCGMEFTAALHSRGRAVFVGTDRYGQKGITAFDEVFSLFCNQAYTAAILKDGTLLFAGEAPVEQSFRAVSHARVLSCGKNHAAVLLGNGRVFISHGGGKQRHEISEWPDVTDVVCGKRFTVGLTPNGRVTVAGGNLRVRHALESWDQIAGLFTDAEGETVYGITAEGRLLSTASLPPSARKWRNLIFVAAADRKIWGVTATGQLCSTSRLGRRMGGEGYFVACAAAPDHAVALTRDGRLMAVGKNDYGQCEVRRCGALFESFDEFSAERHAAHLRTETKERLYQSRLTEAYRYRSRLLCGKSFTACVTADGRVLTTGGFGKARHWTGVRALACGNAHLVALREGATVIADGNDTDGCTAVSEWQRIKSVAAGDYHTLGVTEDGQVLFCGRNDKGQGDVTEWSGIRKVFAADDYTVGLGYDGTLHIAGRPPFKTELIHNGWNSPADLAVTSTHIAALYPDGTVLTTNTSPASDRPGDGEVWDTVHWHGVRQIAVGRGFTVGLCYGGRVLTTGQFDVSDWRDVVEIACGDTYILGLTAEGRVLSAGMFPTGTPAAADTPSFRKTLVTVPADTAAWKDVIALTAGVSHAVAMTTEGTVLAAGADTESQCSATTHFSLFRDVRQLYGYGKYRKLEEDSADHTGDQADQSYARGEAPTLVPFAQFSAHLRADAEALTERLTGSDAHFSALCEDASPVTYRYETAKLIGEAEGDQPRSLASLGEETLFLYADGTARLRESHAPEESLKTLPDRLGDSHFYRVRGVASGKQHYAVLLRDGTVRCYGDNSRSQCDTDDWRGITAVFAGDHHTIGLRADGTVVAVGAQRKDSGNRFRSATGHLPRANPCAVEGWTGITDISCAGDVTLGITSDGKVKAVGNALYGQCNTDTWRGAVSAVTSGAHTVALFADGHVEAVGRNESGECDTESWYHVVQIAVMPELTLGLRSDGRVLAAGRHNEVLHTLEAVRAMACFGTRRQIFVMSDGTLRIHIRGSEFLPEPVEGVRLFTPTPKRSILDRYMVGAPALHSAKRVQGVFAVGMAHTLSLGKGGTIIAAGAGANGQLDLKAYGTAVQVAAGHYHSAAILADGRLVLSGKNTYGQSDARALNRELDIVGITAEESRGGAVPVVTDRDPALLPYAWKQVACGLNHTVALRSDGRVYAIGQNPDGRCDTRKWRDVTYLACGIRHTVAVTAEGTCVAAGDNRYGQCDTMLWKQITMAAAGEYHTVALRADGRVEAAGDNRKGQCRVEDLRGIISVACLPEATLCVTSEGRVIIRGGSGQHDKAIEALREVVAIHTCEHRVAALTVDRRVILIP